MSNSTSRLAKSSINSLSLKGSCKTVTQFFEYSINSLLYQRGIYPAQDFEIVRKYGLNMMMSTDEDVKAYIRTIMTQLHKWVYGGKITQLVVPIIDKDTDQVVERWLFDLHINQPSVNDNVEAAATSAKSKEQIQKEIQAIIRQITASVTFLPVLQGPHTFNVLVYTNSKSSAVPYLWKDTNGDGKIIEDGEVIQFRSFSTDNHKVGAFVSYKVPDTP